MTKMAGKDETPEMFAEKMDEIVEHMTIAHGITIGARVGLFDVLKKFTEPKTCLEIAAEAGLNERYVKEWLALMVTSKIILMSKDDNTYFLPRSRVEYFSNANRYFVFEQFCIMFPAVADELTACFRQGGGIPYSSYKGFHEMMSAMSASNHRDKLLTHHLPSIEGLVEKLESGIKCLDIGCGMGLPSILMGEKYPNSEMYGFDFEEEAINNAKKAVEEKNLNNVHFMVQDCAVIDSKYHNTFDYISSHDAIHDQARPADVLSGVYKMLKDNGIFSMVDVDARSHPVDNINVPKATLKYGYSLFHCMPVSLYFEGGAGLGTCWGREVAVEMLENAGFKNIMVIPYHHKDNFNIHYLARKH